MEHNIERMENRKWKTDQYYKLVHRYKRDIASIISDITQAKCWQRVVRLLFWSICSYSATCFITLVLIVDNTSPQTILSGWRTHKRAVETICYRYKACVQIAGTFTIFWAIGFLILLKLEYSNLVLAYSMVAFGVPILWVVLRRFAQMKF